MKSEKKSAKHVKRSFVACYRCHSHKIKCSGGNPCASCKASDDDANCRYPSRERKITVSERLVRNSSKQARRSRGLDTDALRSYLKRLERDAESLTTYQRSTPVENHVSLQTRQQPSDESRPSEIDDLDVSNALFDEIGPCQTDAHSLEPSFIGEAACSAFGDRLLQCVDKNYTPSLTSSLSYFKNRTLNRLLSKNYDLPNRIEVKLLIQIASKFVGNDQHLYLRKTFLEELDAVYQHEAQPSTPWLCKLFALLALGEFYSHRKKSIDNYSIPGTAYYLRAINLLQDIYEDATVTQVETLILISCFANGLGRVKAAYTYTGIAMRLSLILGLHRSIPASSEISAVERENRRRIWWTLYHFDRVAASKLGYPITIRDEDIDVEMPSMNGLTPLETEEFADPSHLVAKVELAKITGNILNDIYGLPGRVQGTFVQRVHGILKELRAWDHALPEDIRTCNERSPRHVASLHLAYNQLIITTTRPILLHIFKSQFQLGVKSATLRTLGFSTTTLALSEACVNAARTSGSILTRLFIDGSIATFGYLDAHHLFSSTLILIMSAVMSPCVATSEAVQLSSNVLRAMRDHGNVPAGDYCERLSRIQSSVSHMRAEVEKNLSVDIAASTPNQDLQLMPESDETGPRSIAGDFIRVPDLIPGASPPRQQFPYSNFDAGNGNMDVLAHPLIEDFLGGNWLAWPGEPFPGDNALRAVAMELDDNRLLNS